MARIPENVLNEIQDRCDIVEIISSYIPLKPAGRNFKALCPFHHEKTPSFIVSPDKQIFHCFGCNVGGNVFHFIKQYEKMEFIEVVRMLAEKTGVRLPRLSESEKEGDSLISAIYSANDLTANYYSTQLYSEGGREALEYLAKRGISKEIQKKFRLGLATKNWTGLVDYAKKRGLTLEVLEKAGLIQRSKEGTFYDLFRNRIMIPIFDVRNRIIGFGARTLENLIPKYINSPESPVFVKGRHLYGLNFAIQNIRETGFAIVTEGYMDVITPVQAGFLNVVSSLGTALTIEQIRLLKRYNHKVVMIYDADQAGQIATLRGLDLFLGEAMAVEVAVLPEGQDPDSFIRNSGAEAFKEVLSNAKDLFDYKLEILCKGYDINNTEEKVEIAREMLGSISKIEDAVLKSEYIKKLSQVLELDEASLLIELKKLKKNRPSNFENFKKIDGLEFKVRPAERLLIKLIVEDTSLIESVKNELKPLDFKNPQVRKLIESLFNLSQEPSRLDTAKLINYLEGCVPSNLISFLINEEMEIKDKEKNIFDCIKAIKKENRDERAKGLQNKIAIAQKEGDDEGVKRLLSEFNALIKSPF